MGCCALANYFSGAGGRGRAEPLPAPPALPPDMISNVVTEDDEEDDDADQC